MDKQTETVAAALERLAITLGENGAVPVGELVRALERAAERLRLRYEPSEAPPDLVTQAEASRVVGVSRQAVNQWVRKGTLRIYESGSAGGRSNPRVSLSEVAIAANRRAPAAFSPVARRELMDFLERIRGIGARDLARSLRDSLTEDSGTGDYSHGSQILQEFVVAAMESGDRKREFTAEGVRRLADLRPEFVLDTTTDFGGLAESLGLLVHSSVGVSGFDSAATALLGLLGVATVGTRFCGDDTAVAHTIADAAREVWGEDWTARLYDAVSSVGGLRPPPLVRYTASLTYLDNNRFLRQAQSSGVTIAYARGPGAVLPQRFYGAPIHNDILRGSRLDGPVWAFTKDAAAAVGRPTRNPSAVNPFRVFNYEYGLLDGSIHGIRRYCFSTADARAELTTTLGALPSAQRKLYLSTAVETLARTLAQPFIELVAIDAEEDFDWWKDHLIRASEREILIGLRDDDARRVSHALLVQTNTLPSVVEAADSDSALRDRLRIYVKNLEFDVIEARYADDLRRGTARMLKAGGQSLTEDESYAIAKTEIDSLLA
ncbi:hypothetical protein [Nocardia miyunensis]|uniref:hypothetical protein n=1 Tax=Nocardia miyunensis TaxID=282684 RepID=UPI0008342998|nr:hypothetical protein [Nocardia miyunensis]